MTVTLDHDGIRADTARHVAKLMAAAAITAPKSGGQLFLQGKHLFVETSSSTTTTPCSSWPAGCGPGATNAASRSGSATPTHKVVGFDRRIDPVDFDACHPDLPDDTLPA